MATALPRSGPTRIDLNSVNVRAPFAAMASHVIPNVKPEQPEEVKPKKTNWRGGWKQKLKHQ
jgi:hypothetical protein